MTERERPRDILPVPRPAEEPGQMGALSQAGAIFQEQGAVPGPGPADEKDWGTDVALVETPQGGLGLPSRESPLDKVNPQIREYLLERFSEAQLSLLLQKTPRREVRTRLLNPNKPEGPGNPRLRYVEHAYVTETLNFLFGFNWDLEVLEQQRLDNEAVVKARLRVRLPDGTAICKDSFGGAFYQPNNPNASWADTFKAAESDALKAAAARLGIGLDLYRHEEQLQEAKAPGLDRPTAPAEKSPEATRRGERDWNWFWGKAKELGIARDEVHARLRVASVKDWVAQGRTLEEAINVLKGGGEAG